MQRVDDRVNDPHDRRHFSAWCGEYVDVHGNRYQRVLMWHPLMWWEVLKPGSLCRGARLLALRSYWRNRKVLVERGSEFWGGPEYLGSPGADAYYRKYPEDLPPEYIHPDEHDGR